jgi:hypothetical protein
MASCSVVTAITGSKDDLINEQVKGNAEFVAFLDYPFSSDTWEIRRAYDRFYDPRRNSRIHKLLIHSYVDTEYSIWIDGNVSLLVPPEELIAKHLNGYDIAVYKHPTRDCLYQEAMTCAKLGLDDTEVIIEQARTYEIDGFAKHRGLGECNIILRRHTEKVRTFNEIWWSHYTRYSRRDQISFPYALDQAGLRVNLINDFFIEDSPTHAIKQSGDIEIITHSHTQ